ncbi:MAG: hypothetical protein R3F21_17940 [Myxococcota bacterium]
MQARSIVSHALVALLAFAIAWFALPARQGERSVPARPADPVAAFAEVLAIEDAHARAQALLDYFAAADPAWADRLRAEIAKPDGSGLALDELSEVLLASWWAKSDPAAAFENRVDPGWPNRHPWLREVMRTWSSTDPQRAAEAAATLPPNPDRGRVEVARVLVEHWWDQPTSPEILPLYALISELPVLPRAGAIQRLIEKSIEHRGIDATEQFIESLPKQEDFGVSVQQEMLARFGQALVDHDIERAKAWGLEHGQGRDGSGILRHMAFSWGAKDGPTAMEWATHLPESPERPGIVMRVWISFRNAHADEAEEWLLSQEPSSVLEPVFKRYLSGTATIDPQRALAFADRTKDPEMRERLLAAVGIGWMKTDPEAARQWLDTVELAPALEARILQSKVFDPVQSGVLVPTS